MRKISKIFLILTAFLMLCSNIVFAKEVKTKYYSPKKTVAIMIDDATVHNLEYFMYSDVSRMAAIDITNKINADKVVYAIDYSTVQRKLDNIKMYDTAQKTLNNYKYTLNIDLVELKKIAMALGTSRILLITGNVDIQKDFLRPTFIGFLNIPSDVVKPQHRINTYYTLVDTNQNLILWQKIYTYQLYVPNFGLGLSGYSPDYKQLDGLKKHSIHMANDVAYRVEYSLEPEIMKEEPPPTVPEKVKYQTDKGVKAVKRFHKTQKEKILQKKEEKRIKKLQLIDSQKDIKVNPVTIIIPKM